MFRLEDNLTTIIIQPYERPWMEREKKNNTRRREDMNYIFEWKDNILRTRISCLFGLDD